MAKINIKKVKITIIIAIRIKINKVKIFALVKVKKLIDFLGLLDLTKCYKKFFLIKSFLNKLFIVKQIRIYLTKFFLN